ncbi:hypothetical protein DYB32_005809 [Aphanomyces invadans]|uniref:CHAT domain-containing protein n=1 Tax=Aphanomyces invadans TaxID=157072 RepID=A0A3R7CZ40_9STRA|nr:hypothetical protein DYB32_005809 [Aphanomyces invadans]
MCMAVTEVSREVTLSVHFATSDSLRSLMTLGCRALHFSGHGSPQHLYFEDGLGTVHPIPINDLKNLCISKNSPLRLVVVQACYSHNVGAFTRCNVFQVTWALSWVATAFLSCGIPHVIAIKFDQKIEDIASSFVLLPDGADHSEVIFPTLDVKTSAAPTMVPNPTRFPVLWGSTKLPAACPRMLVVLDECDAVISTDADQRSFASVVHNVLTNHFALKLILTARTNIVSDRLQTHGGSPYRLGCLTANKSADLLRRHITRKLSLNEVQLSPLAGTMQHPNPMENLTRVVAAHPLIERTQGLPKAIVQLASRINAASLTLDQLAAQFSTSL